jgi:2,3-diaminopropionate biosynthesis protein SbnA
MNTHKILTEANPLSDALSRIGKLIGNTPLYKLRVPYCNLYTKLEYYNAFGSIKDRPAFFILGKAIAYNQITRDTAIVESTSGNFGIALASICRVLGVKFIPVIDPAISSQKERILRLISHEVIKVTERDETGGFLLNRIRTVKDFLKDRPNSYNPNQYENPNNYLSYYHTLGEEICKSFSRLDYAFICVSSGGTIIGLSNKLKEKYPKIVIVAIDVEGSLIFSTERKIRMIPGIGSSMRSPLMDHAMIDDVIILSQADIVRGAHELLNEHSIFLGASSGAAYMGAKLFLSRYPKGNKNAIFISPDNGNAYLDTIFSEEWVEKNIMLKNRPSNEIY